MQEHWMDLRLQARSPESDQFDLCRKAHQVQMEMDVCEESPDGHSWVPEFVSRSPSRIQRYAYCTQCGVRR